MADIIKMKPTSAGRRFTVRTRDRLLHRGRPHSALTKGLPRTSGHNNHGRITVRHRGGGHKRLYRIIDFKRDKDGIQGRVKRIEYDPNRSANIALIVYADGEYRYIIAPDKLSEGDVILSGEATPIRPGNTMRLADMPLGTPVHCVELKPGKGAQLARAAGTSANYVANESGYAILKMSSGEMRRVLNTCRATIGRVGNVRNNLCKFGKAGAKRWRGVRPTVRGVAMNPIDHPHGGGEGKTSGGRHPVSPWGQPTKGYRTRKNPRTDKLIVRRRKK